MAIDVERPRRGRRPLLVGLALAAVSVAFAVAWLVPRTDVPTQFRLVPLNNASIGDREIVVVNYRAGGSPKIRPNSTTRAS